MKHCYRLALLTLLFLAGITAIVEAGHKAGAGNISWECVGKDSFEVDISVYKECPSSVDPNPGLNVDCKSSGSIGNITTQQIGSSDVTDITPSCDSICTACSSSSCNVQSGYEKHTITYLVDLNNTNCCKVRFSYSGFRSGGGLNCGNIYVASWFNYCQAPRDNAPEFKSPPLNVICKKRGVNRNLRAYDPDTTANGNLRDSVAFELAPPRETATSNCSYSTQKYSYKKPLQFQGFPNAGIPYPYGFHLDEESGQLKFVPQKQEITTLSYKVKEYRDTNNNGKKELIGEVYREYQLSVINCKNNSNPSVRGPECNANFTKAAVCAGDTADLTFCTNDPNSGDTVSVEFNRGMLPDTAKWSVKNPDSLLPTGKLQWIPKPKDVRKKPYKFTIGVKDDHCPLNGRSTKQYEIKVNPALTADYKVEPLQCGRFRLKAKATTNENADLTWDGKGGIHSEKDTFVHQFHKPGKHPFTLTVETKHCRQVYKDTIDVKPFLRVKMGTDTTVCKGSNITLGDTAIDNQGKVTYKWQDGVTGDSVRTFKQMLRDTLLTLRVKDRNCSYVDSVQVQVQEQPKIDLGADTQRVCESDSLRLQVNGSLAAYSWNTGDTNFYVYGDSKRLYTVTASDTLGCSTTDSVQLQTLRADTITRIDTSCHSYTWPVTGKTYHAGDSVIVSKQNTAFCDSTATHRLYLTILKRSQNTIRTEVCNSYTVPSGDTTYKQSGMYTDTLHNNAGCDSILNIQLTVNQSESHTDSVKRCKRYTWPVTGKNYMRSGVYSDTFSNRHDCDSVRKLVLTIKEHKTETLNPVVCDSYTVPSGDETYNSSGTYMDTLATGGICDSLLTINLNVQTFDTGIRKDGTTLISQDTSADHQWLDCNAGYAPVNGATSRRFSPDSNRSYAVKLSENDCADTSACYEVKSVGIVSNELGESLKVFPNPTEQTVTVELGERYKQIQTVLRNSKGKTLYSSSFSESRRFELQLEGSAGYYFLEIRTANGKIARVKLLKD